uniref:AIG1-type G domain-containing protein n=1 Tax=Esox lucius TaxID=8010 RepID=A0A3P8XPN3_ESOLU
MLKWSIIQRVSVLTSDVCCVTVGGESSSPDSPVSPSGSELRLVLLGRTGAGRRAAGNTILGREEFGAQASPSAVTQKSVRREGEVCGRHLVLVDTPDWFCPGLSLEEIKQDVGLCVRLSAPGSHAFLLVIPVEPSKEEERGVLERMEERFGEGCWGHTVILFTHDDSLKEQSIEEFLQVGSQDLQEVVEKCGSRYHVLNIKDRTHDTQVQKGGSGLHGLNKDNTSVMPPKLRLVLLGRTGAGRRAAGNTILGREEFGAQASPSAVTQRSVRREGEVCGRHLVLVDTPDWFCPGLSLEEMRQDVGLCVRLSAPGPHAFLLVIPVEPSKEEERGVLERMEEMFGEGCWRHTVILFTHDDSLKEQSIEGFLQAGSQDLQQLVEKCGSRYHVLNIKDRTHDTQVPELLEKIEEMVSGNRESFYCSQTYQEAEAQVREMERKIQKEMEERKQRKETEMKDRLNKELQESLKKIEGVIQEHEGDIRTLNDRTTELERQWFFVFLSFFHKTRSLPQEVENRWLRLNSSHFSHFRLCSTKCMC